MKALAKWVWRVKNIHRLPHSTEEAREIFEQQMQLDENEVDAELLEACLSILQPDIMNNPPHKKEVHNRIFKGQRPYPAKRTKHMGIKTRMPLLASAVLAVALLIVIILPIANDLVFGNQDRLFGQTQEDDGETYLVEGKESGDLMPKGRAGADDSLVQFETTNLDEIRALCSLDISVPTWLPEGWTLKTYTYGSVDAYEKFGCVYENPSFEYLIVYYISKSAEPEYWRTEVEQNGPGEDIVLDNGREAYTGSNMGRFFCTWLTDNCIHLVSVPTTKEDMILIVNSIEEV